MTDDFSHLDAIDQRIVRETERLHSAKTEAERAFCTREIASAKKERVAEVEFLAKRGLVPATLEDVLMSDDELLAELLA